MTRSDLYFESFILTVLRTDFSGQGKHRNRDQLTDTIILHLRGSNEEDIRWDSGTISKIKSKGLANGLEREEEKKQGRVRILAWIFG